VKVIVGVASGVNGNLITGIEVAVLRGPGGSRILRVLFDRYGDDPSVLGFQNQFGGGDTTDLAGQSVSDLRRHSFLAATPGQ